MDALIGTAVHDHGDETLANKSGEIARVRNDGTEWSRRLKMQSLCFPFPAFWDGAQQQALKVGAFDVYRT